MAVVDRNILRLAIYELGLNQVPAVIVIDEALELAKQFSNPESLSFINGVLDAIYKQAKSAGLP
jgi:N utilization substance protein B